MTEHPIIPPFRICGSTYFVGEYRASSHLIDTGEGLILIDTGYEETADVIMAGLKELGFDIKDVKIILHSHGHGDHTHGTRRLLEHCTAETCIAREDVKLLGMKSGKFCEELSFTPTRFLNDGDTISLGNTEILCLHTPGHTEGTYSFFWNVEENGRVYRAGTFGGAGVNQMKKRYLSDRALYYFQRGAFYESLDRLMKEKVDVFIGNHAWNNDTYGKYLKTLNGTENPFIDSSEFNRFIKGKYADADRMIKNDTAECFVNFAHRGASEYAPENTLMSFYLGLYMGANGIETDVQKTKDGVLVLFHDDTLERVTGQPGAISDYTFLELQSFDVCKDGLTDKIVSLEDFLARFAYRDITLAIELKEKGLEKEVCELVYKYGAEKKCTITSFRYDALTAMKKCAPNLKLGYLTLEVTDELLDKMKLDGIDEICPRAEGLTVEDVWKWQKLGFNVRAWGVSDEELMKAVLRAGADGMTCNFPDKLFAALKEKGSSVV